MKSILGYHVAKLDSNEGTYAAHNVHPADVDAITQELKARGAVVKLIKKHMRLSIVCFKLIA